MASSSSEEDEEERRKLAEVAGIAAKDIRDALVLKSHRSSSQTSLRSTKDDEQDISCQLTPEFRKHVAKKLSSYIESCLQEESSDLVTAKKKEKETGIHLFNLSKEKITEMEENGFPTIQKSTPKSKNKKHCPSESDSSDNEEALARFAEAAVSGQSIIDNGLAGNSIKPEEEDKQHNEAKFEENTEQTKKKHKKKKKKTHKLKEMEDDVGHRERKKHKKSKVPS